MSDLVTVVGTVCKEDPTLRFTSTGLAICSFSVREPGKKARGDLPAQEARFWNVEAWRELGESVAESLQNGDRVIIQGLVKTNTWTNKEGEEKSKQVLNAWNVGAELSYATVEITRNERRDSRPADVPVPGAAAPAADYGDF